ncbi:unnamed protein product [Medioppia subpectinata]|uniref:Uncharacterized protein n=1 Tax=Medioppia subpectinata TaxID=1979941 RepID=A0A7R9LKA9_9ACAR|nr:unnamed protein product [Medioppia subpectinata]CAG2119560.1 unnamed protein product [Medioppia subpectinata]
MVEEHLVAKDENGYSLDHMLVSDTSRSLINELDEEIESNKRVMKAKQLQKNYRSNSKRITSMSSEDIESIMRSHINKKDVLQEKHKERMNRELIVYNDLHFFQ